MTDESFLCFAVAYVPMTTRPMKGRGANRSEALVSAHARLPSKRRSKLAFSFFLPLALSLSVCLFFLLRIERCTLTPLQRFTLRLRFSFLFSFTILFFCRSLRNQWEGRVVSLLLTAEFFSTSARSRRHVIIQKLRNLGYLCKLGTWPVRKFKQKGLTNFFSIFYAQHLATFRGHDIRTI